MNKNRIKAGYPHRKHRTKKGGKIRRSFSDFLKNRSFRHRKEKTKIKELEDEKNQAQTSI